VALDVLGNGEWQRIETTPNILPGHIPGAVHLIWNQLIDPLKACASNLKTLYVNCLKLTAFIRRTTFLPIVPPVFVRSTPYLRGRGQSDRSSVVNDMCLQNSGLTKI